MSVCFYLLSLVFSCIYVVCVACLLFLFVCFIFSFDLCLVVLVAEHMLCCFFVRQNLNTCVDKCASRMHVYARIHVYIPAPGLCVSE